MTGAANIPPPPVGSRLGAERLPLLPVEHGANAGAYWLNTLQKLWHAQRHPAEVIDVLRAMLNKNGIEDELTLELPPRRQQAGQHLGTCHTLRDCARQT